MMPISLFDDTGDDLPSLQSIADAIAVENVLAWQEHRETNTLPLIPATEKALSRLALVPPGSFGYRLMQTLVQSLRTRQGMTCGPVSLKDDWVESLDLLSAIGKEAAAHPGILEELLKALKQKQNEFIRWHAASVLGQLGNAEMLGDSLRVFEQKDGGYAAARRKGFSLSALWSKEKKGGYAVQKVSDLVRGLPPKPLNKTK